MVNIQESLVLLDKYLRIPTVSNEITPAMVEQVRAFWQVLGLELDPLWADQPATDKVQNPALYSEVRADVPDAPTLLLYGHWDVQPAGDLSQWRWREQISLPFEPTYFLDERFLGHDPAAVLVGLSANELPGALVVARGSADNKGQHLASLLGVLRAKAAHKLKWNVKVILDGEEEVGSPNLKAIVETHRGKLKADFMVGSDGPKSDNRPTLLLGVRGLLMVEVTCHNRSGRMLHSGNYGNVVPNPALPLAHLLDRMAEAAAEMGRVAGDFRLEVDKFFPRDLPDRRFYDPFLSPTFNINSFSTEGATGKNGQRRTIIPGWAEASVDVRLTPGLDPQAVFAGLAELVEAANRERSDLVFEIVQQSACAASYTSPEREGFSWLKTKMEQYWQSDLRVIPLLGGTLPSDAFTDGLGLAAYWLPAANSNNRQHDTNEHFVLEHFFRQQEFYEQLVSSEYV
jgi:acetylornithine deacetylase/succinyl-diaminopimelate desuccinylase-like protein